MNKFVNNIVLTSTLLAPMLAGAATFSLGDFPGGSGFSNADKNSSAHAPFNQLPSNGPFSDDWNFTVSPNTGGSSNVAITGIGSLNLSGLNAMIVNAGGISSSFTPLFANASNQLIGLTFSTLAVGNYTLRVSGNTFGLNTDSHSYSGNLSIGNDPVATPIPAAVWLFGSSLAGIMGFVGRKKR